MDALVAELRPVLGRHTADRAVAIVLQKLERTEQSLHPQDMPEVRKILLPMLRQLVGSQAAQRVLDRVENPDEGGGGS